VKNPKSEIRNSDCCVSIPRMTKKTSDREVRAEEVLTAIRKRGRKGLTAQQLVNQFAAERKLGRSDARRLLRPALKELQRDGRVVLGRGKRYFVAESSNLVTGTLRRVAGGHMEVAVTDRGGSPVRIPPQGMRGALDGDTVVVRLEKPRKRARADGVREGVIIRVVERGRREVVGRWVVGDAKPHVRPLDRRLRFTVAPTGSRIEGEPEEGEMVVISIDSVDSRGRHARGVLLERLGRADDPGVVERVVLRQRGIPVEFPAEALAEAELLPSTISSEELASRADRRGEPVITIDGRTARDFDDAVSARALAGSGIEVEVHIADVSHFVRPGMALDTAARGRGTSVYLPGLCVPMLPERLSNDLCSLREGEDRLTWTARFTVDRNGEITARSTEDSVIRSRRRCTYAEVAEWLERPRSDWPKETAGFAESLELLTEAAGRLGRARRDHGSLDFDLAEPELILDPEGRVVAIQPAARNRAHRLIEELMVAANRCVAGILIEAGQPGLHRVHDEPEATRVEELKRVVADLGLRLDGDPHSLEPAALQALLESHVADKTLPRSGGSPHAEAAANGGADPRGLRTRRGGGGAGEAGRVVLCDRATGRGSGARSGRVEDRALPARTRGRGLCRPHFGGHRLRTLCAAGRDLGRRHGPHLGDQRRPLPVRRAAPPAGGGADGLVPVDVKPDARAARGGKARRPGRRRLRAAN